MTIDSVKIEFRRELATLYGPKESLSIFEMIAEDAGFSRNSLLLEGNQELTDSQKTYFERCLNRLKSAEPVQYVRGKAEFYGLQFAVNQSVLIPRQETEELVDLIIRENRDCRGRIVDIGTGSGCIAVSLAKNIPLAQVCAVDISEQALNVACENARKNGVDVDFFLGDMQDESFMRQLNDCEIVVSNPPYVCLSEKPQMRPNVLDFEPHLALFVTDENPLQFYESIAQFASKNLVEGGKFYCEINETLGVETKRLFEQFGFTQCEIVKDLFGKDRIVRGEKR